MLVEPRHRLLERLLLGELLALDLHVAADREAVARAGVEVDLVRHVYAGQDLLRPVALVGGEDLVRLGGGDGQGARDGGELVLVDEGGVCDETSLDAALVVADDVLESAVVSSESNTVSRGRETSSEERQRWGDKRHTFPPKQYPTAPIFLKPMPFSASIPATVMGSTASLV